MVRTMKLVTDPNLIKQLEQGDGKEEKKESSLLDKISGVAEKFNRGIEATHLPELAGGLLQGAGDVGVSLANVAAKPLGYEIPHPNLKQYIPHGFGSLAAFSAGELASQIPLFMGGAGLIGKAGIGAEAGIGGKAVQGALAGGLMGENSEGGGRLLSGLLGAAVPTGIGLAQKGLSLRSKNIAANVLQSLEKSKQEYANKFGNIFEEARNRGISENFRPIAANQRLLGKAGNKDYLYALNEFNANPTLEAAHEAQSQLGKYVNKIGKPTSTLDRHAIEEANRVKKAIQDHIMEHLRRSGNTDLAIDYNMAKQGYKQEVAPYLNSKTVNQLLEGKLLPNKFAPKIAQEESFIAKIGQHKHPEIQQREFLKNIAKSKMAQTIAAVLAAELGLHGIGKLLK